MTMGVFLCVQSQEDLSGLIARPMELAEILQRQGTNCLLASKYATEPGLYTMEALMINLQNEFVRRRDAHLGVWILSGIAIRLAMRQGYHRDPERYPQISVYHGEMRRRMWACIIQLDGLTSYQLGLPPMVQERQCDTRLPRNLFDEDFGPESTHLPASRPDTEVTPVLYLITKSELSRVFRQVVAQVSLGHTDNYDDIISLHHRLYSARDSISPRFRMADLKSCVTVAPYILVRRYTLELLFQKTLVILHRHHMAKALRDRTYEVSRQACVGAAMAILSHKADLARESRPGAILYGKGWVLSSIEQSDFLLASAVVCLELSFRAREATHSAGPSSMESTPSSYSQTDLINVLQQSHQLLDSLKDTSTDCRQAFNTLSFMLRKSNARGQLGGSNGHGPQPPNAPTDCIEPGQTFEFGECDLSELNNDLRTADLMKHRQCLCRELPSSGLADEFDGNIWSGINRFHL